MTAGFEMPPGDPDAIASGLGALGVLLTDLDARSRELGRGLDVAGAGWRAPRADEFTRAGTGIAAEVGRARSDLEAAAEVLARYLRALRSARQEIADLGDQARRRLGSTQDDIDSMDTPEGPDAVLARQHADRYVAGLADQADLVRARLRHLAAQAADELDRTTASIVPGGEHLPSDAIRLRVVTAYGVERSRAGLAAATLTDAAAWAVLTAATLSAPPVEWQAWAGQYGLTTPQQPDLGHGLELKARLEQVRVEALGLPPEERADFIDDQFVHESGRRLSDEDLVSLALVDPALVGNLDGLPNRVRYFANRINVFHAVASEQARLDTWRPPPPQTDAAYVDYVRLRRRIDVLRRVLGDQPLTGHDRQPVKQVLAFVPPTYDGFRVTDDGRMALVVGDLDRAHHVGVVVPGITNRLDNFGATFDKAWNTRELAGDDTATVAWLGYDTPELHDAVTDADAVEGGRTLHDFLAGLRRAAGSDLTLMAHSYGTLVTAKALELGKDRPPIPDRVVLFGSPGLGEDVHSAADLGLPPGYPVYALRAPGDPVSITAAWGTDPVELPGITRLDTDWTDDGREPVGHSQYTDRGTDSLRNIVGVLEAIPPDELHVGGPSLDADGLLGRYNGDLRRLVDLLQAEVPAEVQSAFARGIEAELERRLEAGALAPGSPADLHEVLALIRSASEESGITDHLTSAELHRAIREAGFTRTLGDQVGDEVEQWLDEVDRLALRGPLAPRLPWPDDVEHRLALLTGELTAGATAHLGDWAVERLPSLDTVLDAGDAVAAAWSAYDETRDGLRRGWDVVRATPVLVRDAGSELAEDAARAGSGIVGGITGAGERAWQRATGWLP